MEKVDLFSLLVEQHEKIKDAIKEAKAALEAVRDGATPEKYRQLVDGLYLIRRLLLEHGKVEEEQLMPILSKIYHPQAEMVHYVKDEHIHLEQEINALVESVKQQWEERRERMADQVYLDIKKFLDQMTVHMFEEESGMFPLLQVYLKSQA